MAFVHFSFLRLLFVNLSAILLIFMMELFYFLLVFRTCSKIFFLFPSEEFLLILGFLYGIINLILALYIRKGVHSACSLTAMA
jgi:hypothetical protein